MAIASAGARWQGKPDAEDILSCYAFDEQLHEKYQRSLENFDPEAPHDGTPILTSPRSLEACLRLGVLPEELRKL